MSHLDRTRTAYDTVARPYAVLLKDELGQNAWDRAVLAAFAEAVTGPVLDAGCGPGRLTGHLADLGLKVGGLDLSPEMIAVARGAHRDGDRAPAAGLPDGPQTLAAQGPLLSHP